MLEPQGSLGSIPRSSTTRGICPWRAKLSRSRDSHGSPIQVADDTKVRTPPRGLTSALNAEVWVRFPAGPVSWASSSKVEHVEQLSLTRTDLSYTGLRPKPGAYIPPASHADPESRSVEPLSGETGSLLSRKESCEMRDSTRPQGETCARSSRGPPYNFLPPTTSRTVPPDPGPRRSTWPGCFPESTNHRRHRTHRRPFRCLRCLRWFVILSHR